MDKKALFRRFGAVLRPLLRLRNLFCVSVRRRGHGNRVKGLDRILARKCKIRICGNNNEIVFGEMTTAERLRISVEGNGNRILIGERNYFLDCELVTEGDGNTVSLGNHVYIHNQSQLAATEGKRITLGEDCLLSSRVEIRTGDSHAILDAATGARTNPAQDVSVGNHVWIGTGAMLLKGVRIGNNCVIGAASVVTAKLPEEDYTAAAGNPACIVRRGVDWRAERETPEEL